MNTCHFERHGFTLARNCIELEYLFMQF